MKYKTYAEIANELSRVYCGHLGYHYVGDDPKEIRLEEAAHRTGYVYQHELHWTERRVTRSGIRRFLLMAYNLPILTLDPMWLRHWRQVEWVRHTARTKLHVKIPPELWAESKARLGARLANDTDPRFKEERKKALRWTKR